MLTVVAYVCLIVGSQVYNKYFRDTEYRKLIIIDALIAIIIAPI